MFENFVVRRPECVFFRNQYMDDMSKLQNYVAPTKNYGQLLQEPWKYLEIKHFITGTRYKSHFGGIYEISHMTVY